MNDEREAFESRLRAGLEANVDFYQGFVSVDRLSGGASQETYRIMIQTRDGERPLAMRRAPGGVRNQPMPGYPGLATEALLMQSARAVGVPEPEVYWILQPDDGLGDGFIMEWIEGEALGARINRSEEFDQIRPQLAYQCGEILARIHAIDLKETCLDQHLGVISPADYIEQTWGRYKLMATPQPMIDYAARWLKENLPTSFDPTLVHNDFRNGNFLLTPDGITAILDWEVAHIGDPMRDLGWICTNSWRFGGGSPVGGFGEYADLFAGYESVSGKVVDPDHVKFWEVFGSFWWAVGCLSMAEHYRTGPDKTVERPAIGRRSSECQVDCVNLIIPGPVESVAESTPQDLDMPRADELLTSVRDFLRSDVMGATQGRTNFMARVASNSLDIVLREMSLGEEHHRRELQRLQHFYNSTDDLETLRWRLVNELRDESLCLDDPDLQVHLRQTVVNQIAIDQPRYSGYKTAIS
jgi:aminoglycoside phosphotransferase (APT) family kinase protein